jgi:tripartite-type tricarboxylate transporter receptor subunit TctC
MRLFRLLLACFAALCGDLAVAQDYPSHPVKIVVTFTQGGAADITARVFGDKLTELWKQQVIIENRIGAGGSIGAEAVYRAAPDGYTLLLATNTHIINHVLYTKLPFDFTKDFPALGLVTSAPMMIAVHPSLPANNLKEFTALLKAAPGKYDYAACNVASPHHFAMEMYKYEMGIDAVHISHRGCTPAVTDTVAGHLKIVATSVPAGLAFVKQGRLRPIALLSKDRSPSLPDVPTVHESGIPELKDFSLDNYYGFMAPPGTPAVLLAKIEADIRRVAAMPEVRQRLDNAGLDMFVLPAGEMMKLIRADAVKYAKAAKLAGIKPE